MNKTTQQLLNLPLITEGSKDSSEPIFNSYLNLNTTHDEYLDADFNTIIFHGKIIALPLGAEEKRLNIISECIHRVLSCFLKDINNYDTEDSRIDSYPLKNINLSVSLNRFCSVDASQQPITATHLTFTPNFYFDQYNENVLDSENNTYNLAVLTPTNLKHYADSSAHVLFDSLTNSNQDLYTVDVTMNYTLNYEILHDYYHPSWMYDDQYYAEHHEAIDEELYHWIKND